MDDKRLKAMMKLRDATQAYLDATGSWPEVEAAMAELQAVAA